MTDSEHLQYKLRSSCGYPGSCLRLLYPSPNLGRNVASMSNYRACRSRAWDSNMFFLWNADVIGGILPALSQPSLKKQYYEQNE